MFGDVCVYVLEPMLQRGEENSPHSRTTWLIEIGVLLHTRCRLALRNRRVDTRSRGTPLLPGHRARGLVTDLPAEDRSSQVRKIWKWLVFWKIKYFVKAVVVRIETNHNFMWCSTRSKCLDLDDYFVSLRSSTLYYWEQFGFHHQKPVEAQRKLAFPFFLPVHFGDVSVGDDDAVPVPPQASGQLQGVQVVLVYDVPHRVSPQQLLPFGASRGTQTCAEADVTSWPRQLALAVLQHVVLVHDLQQQQQQQATPADGERKR